MTVALQQQFIEDARDDEETVVVIPPEGEITFYAPYLEPSYTNPLLGPLGQSE